MPLRDLSIKQKLIAVTALSSGATLLLVGASFATYGIRVSRQTLVRQLRTQAEIIGTNGTPALVFRDERAAAETLAALRAEPQVVLAAIYAADGRPFATYARPRAPGGAEDAGPLPSRPFEGMRFTADSLEVGHRIGAADRPVGTVFLRADLHSLHDQVFAYLVTMGVVVLVCLAVSVGIAVVLQKILSEPILELAGVARRVAQEKNYSARATVRNRDEVGALVENFNEMLAQIQTRDADLNRVNQTLEQRTQELARKNEEVEAFVYIVSHDLRGPLVNIQGFSRELDRSCQALGKKLRATPLPDRARGDVEEILDQEIPSALRFISASTTKFERLINALLQLSRSGRQDYRFEELDMTAAAAATVDALRMNVDRSGATVTVGELPPASGDATAVGQILSNLVVNATNYLQSGRPGRIEIGGERNGGVTNKYWVRDNGVGIPDSARKKLFQVFQRFHPKLAPGDGMGLATVKRIVERHGGTIWAESAEGSGTTFFFTLPAESHPPQESR